VGCGGPEKRTYATMGTASPPPLFWGLDVGKTQVGGVETLHVGVRPSIAEEVEEELARLEGPAFLNIQNHISTNPNSQYSCDLFINIPKNEHEFSERVGGNEIGFASDLLSGYKAAALDG